MFRKHKTNIKAFNRWKKQHFKELKKQCKKCVLKLCEHCYNSEVTLINKKIDEFGVGDTIKKIEYRM